MQSGNQNNNNAGSPIDDTYEDAEHNAARHAKIMEDTRRVPIYFNDELIFNAIINFVEGTGLRPINIRQELQRQLTFLYSGDKSVTRTNRVKMSCNKGMMFLDYVNDDPKLNTRLRVYIWPLQHVLGMQVKKADPEPEEIQEYVSSPKPKKLPPRFGPSVTEPDDNLNAFGIEDRYDKESQLSSPQPVRTGGVAVVGTYPVPEVAALELQLAREQELEEDLKKKNL